MFNKLLIANRGEIACRVIDTAKRAGIPTVAVYSEADSHALHVQQADEAYLLGPAPSSESYLVGEKIIAVAKQAGVDAIHPGYGFLSENAHFAELCADAGIKFVGPSPTALRVMGEKHTAKQTAEAAGVPVLVGYNGEKQDLQSLQQAANKIGYPLLIKASAGGGGKGMRIVGSEDKFEESLGAAKREAKASFGDDYVLLEKYLINPRHIEIQLLADQHGTAVHLFERDCSIQRRQQKIIEEAPAPGLSTELRERMGQAAIAIAKQINYEGVGTIEFLLDDNHDFYFMEMNTRLQVEHPVTERIANIDLVYAQLSVASGEPIATEHIRKDPFGHAIEVRIYAEDPANNFLPCIGPIAYLEQPKQDDNVRIDTGIQQGDQVSTYYDPMLAKLITSGKTREQALANMKKALAQYHVVGLTTNVDYLQQIIRLPAFENADLHTNFIQEHHDQLPTPSIDISTIAAACFWILSQQTTAVSEHDPFSPWQTQDGWQINNRAQQTILLHFQQQALEISICYRGSGFELTWQDQQYLIDGKLNQHQLRLFIDQTQQQLAVYGFQDEIHVFSGYQHLIFQHQAEPDYDNAAGSDANSLCAPMPGTIIDIMVKANEKVAKDSALLILEAMKMEYTIYAPSNGTITDIPFAAGDMVSEGESLIGFTAEEVDDATA